MDRPETRETIDIEALLVRAYREKQVHRLGNGATRHAGRGAIDLLIAMTGPRVGGGGGAGIKVDTSPFAATKIARERELMGRIGAASDALCELHDAVLALPDFYVERAGLDFVVWDRETAASLGQRLEVGQDGAVIVKLRRRGGRGAGRDEMVPAGEPRRLSRIVASVLMIQCGSYAERPHVPDVVVSGQRPIYSGTDKRAVGHEPVYETPLRAVAEARASYAVWHACLGLLAQGAAVRAHLDVTGPAAPAEPWLDARPTILPSHLKPAVAPRRKRSPRKPKVPKTVEPAMA